MTHSQEVDSREADSPSTARAGSRSALAIVFTTILIDFTGFSVLIPVLPLYAERLGASRFEIGLILSLYGLAQLLFLPAWGWVSDRFGRRPVILTSLFGTVVSFVILSLADTLATIYLARVLAGFSAASIGTAQAVVTDLTPPAGRARGMGLIGATFGLGFVMGTSLGGLLAAWHPRAPFLAVAAVSLANLTLAWFRLPESRPVSAEPPDWSDLRRTFVPVPVRLMVSVHEQRLALYLLLFFLIFTAFASLESMFPVYLHDRFGLGELEAGILFGYIGLFIALTQGVLVGRLVGHFGESALVTVGLGMTGIGLMAVAWVPSPTWFWVVGPLIAFGNGIAFPSFTSLYSKACRQDQAGELLGESQSMATTGRVVAPLLAGYAMQTVDLRAPFVIGAVLMGLALLLFLLTRRTLLGHGDGRYPPGRDSVDPEPPSSTFPKSPAGEETIPAGMSRSQEER